MIDTFGYVGAFVFNFFDGSIAQAFGRPLFLWGVIGITVCALITMTTFLYLEHAAEKVRR